MDILYLGLKNILLVALMPLLVMLGGFVGVGLVIAPPILRGFMPSREPKLKWGVVALLAAMQAAWCVLRVPSLWWQLFHFNLRFMASDLLFFGAWVLLGASYWWLQPKR